MATRKTQASDIKKPEIEEPIERAELEAEDSSEETMPAKIKVKTVKMIRESADPNEPRTADVHPEEVANYTAGGWKLAQ